MNLAWAGAGAHFMTENLQRKIVEWDPKIPLWGILLLGLGWASYSWSTMQELKDRVKTTELLLAQVEAQFRDVGPLKSDIAVLKEIMSRIEKKIDAK